MVAGKFWYWSIYDKCTKTPAIPTANSLIVNYLNLWWVYFEISCNHTYLYIVFDHGSTALPSDYIVYNNLSSLWSRHDRRWSDIEPCACHWPYMILKQQNLENDFNKRKNILKLLQNEKLGNNLKKCMEE